MSKMTGVELIAAERERQVSVEGWTPEHDDTHHDASLTRAGMSYTYSARRQILGATKEFGLLKPWQSLWPWHDEWWKPSADPIRNLVKAGALIAAEIDRLQRLENPNG